MHLIIDNNLPLFRSHSYNWFGGKRECGVQSVENAGVWKMKSVENEECGRCGVWKMKSVEDVECGK